MARLPALFASLALGGGALVAAATLLSTAESEDAQARGATGLVSSPVPTLAPSAVPAPDRVRVPLQRLETARERLRADREALEAAIVWRVSTALGSPSGGRLADGVLLPHEGVHFFTWDPARWRTPSPNSRRHATDRLIRTILQVAAAHAADNPGAPRVAVGDLSRPGGGSFDARFGIVGEFGMRSGYLGHVSHQNGLDADIYYPRRDGEERAPEALEEVDLRLAQDLVDRFVAAGAQFVFVGPRTGLSGPPGIVQPLVRHDDHMHVRLRPAR